MKNIYTVLTVFSFYFSFAQTNLITNGSFNSGTSGWSFYNNATVWSNNSYCRSCPQYAPVPVEISNGNRLDNGYGTFWQDINIPSTVNSATLEFYIYISSDEVTTTQDYDHFYVWLNGSQIYVLSNLDENSGYTHISIPISNISNYAGTSIEVKFGGATDPAKPTIFRVDDVSFWITSSTGLPDLVPQNPYATPAILQAGDQIDLSVDIYNQGNATVPSGTTLTYWLSQDQVYTSGVDQWLFDETVSSISPGNSRSESETLTIPSSTLSGTWYILFAADALDDVSEGVFGEMNNVVAYPITITAPAQYGSIRVTIYPSAAVLLNAQWKIDNSGWYNSGDVVNNISLGSHTISYKNIFGWNTPPNETVYIQLNTCTYTDGTYTSTTQLGDITVNINPANAVLDGALWRMDGGSWKQSGDLVSTSYGQHIIDYKSITGWNAPASQTISVSSTPSVISATYTLIGGGCGTDTYPFSNENPSNTDPWLFYYRECVSYVAWKVNEAAGVTNLSLPVNQYPLNNIKFGALNSTGNCNTPPTDPHVVLSNACFWDDVFLLNGYTVNTTPEVGAIAHYGPGEAGPSSEGHVSYVEEVNYPIICISDYNGQGTHEYTLPTIHEVNLHLPNAPGNRTPSKFIHNADGVGGGGTGIEKVNYTLENGLIIYPNPSAGNLKVLFTEVLGSTLTVNVLNSLGQLVYNEKLEGNNIKEHEFDFTSLPIGYYIFEVVFEQKRVRSQFCITR
jgi:surface antigen